MNWEVRLEQKFIHAQIYNTKSRLCFALVFRRTWYCTRFSPPSPQVHSPRQPLLAKWTPIAHPITLLGIAIQLLDGYSPRCSTLPVLLSMACTWQSMSTLWAPTQPEMTPNPVSNKHKNLKSVGLCWCLFELLAPHLSGENQFEAGTTQFIRYTTCLPRR